MARTDYASLTKAPLSQRERADPRQVKNSEGAFVFALDDFARLDRWLILGSDAPTYYASARKLTGENTECLARCLAADPVRTIARITEISVTGRAPKNDAAIYALAFAAMYDANEHATKNEPGKAGLAVLADAKNLDAKVRSLALLHLDKVCRTGTHLFTFMENMKAIGVSRGRKSMRRASAFKRHVGRWFNSKPVDKAALQIIKYRARSNWTHNDVLSIAHPSPLLGIDTKGDPDAFKSRVSLYQWALDLDKVAKEKPEMVAASLSNRQSIKYDPAALPRIVQGHIEAMAATDEKAVAKIVTEYRLPWEAIPTQFATKPRVQEVLLPHMGLTALIRQLGAMTASGVLAPMNANVRIALDKLGDPEQLRRGRVHPFNVLVALAVYKSGQPIAAARFTTRKDGTEREQVRWKPIPAIKDALEEAFYASFKTVVPTGKRTLIGLDVSGSMSSPLMGSPLHVNEGAAAMAMVTARAERDYHIMAFDHGIRDLPITAKTSLEGVLKHTKNINGGGTDCALPMIWALENKVEVDTFCVYTDNETHSGRAGHPFACLREYRQKTGINAKLVVTGMTSTGFSIASPDDNGMLDVVGFDSAAPSIIADFSRGESNAASADDNDD